MPKISTTPTALDWDVYAGDNNRVTFQVTAGDPVDLTGATIAAQARASAASTAVALTGTVGTSGLALGEFTVAWDGEAIRTLLGSLETWQGVWDLQVTLAGETLPRTHFRGRFTATLDVTRTGVVG